MRSPAFAACFAVLSAALAAPCFAVPGPATPPPAKPLAKSSLLRDNPLLQEKVSVEATDKPLGDVLAQLSSTLKVDLTASAKIADQRVTLHLVDQPLHTLMDRLPRLLSHSPTAPRGYYWEQAERPAGSRPAFNLWRDLRSVLDEDYERNYPRREAAVLLRDLRNLSRLDSKERAKYKSDFPYTLFGSDPTDPFAAALKDLSDDQLDALLDGQKIALDPVRFAPFVAAAKQSQRDQWKKDQEVAALDGRPDPYLHGFPAQPDVLPVLSVSTEDRDGDNLNSRSVYDVSIAGMNGGIAFDVYDTTQSRSPDRNPILYASKPPPGPLVDLTPFLTDKTVTPEQRGDLGFTVQVLAKATHVCVYQEAFLKSNSTSGTRSQGLTTLKGTLPQVVAALCAEWNCHAEKVGDDYFFWSRTWALDRAADIPERVLAPWRTRFQKQGGLTLTDDVEIASVLTWPQVNLTLPNALPDSGPWDQKQHYQALRLLGLLSPAETDTLRSSGGLPLADLSPKALDALGATFPKLAPLTWEQFSQAALRLETPPPGWTDRWTGVSVVAAGKSLCETFLALSPPPAAAKPADPPPTAKR